MIDLQRCCPYLTDFEIEKLEHLSSYPYHRGGVVSSAKIDLATLVQRYGVTPLDEKAGSFYFQGFSLARTVEHLSGAFYLLDPSATVVASALGGHTAELVLDLCAAPGGKTISYALCHPDSLIVANEISSKRAKELLFNIERMGLANIIVTNHDPLFFSADFSGFFDRIILDAPCSGSGMYRKDEKVRADWSPAKVNRLSTLQKELISISAKLLKKGGLLSYSTCSFSPEEDEEVVIDFLAKNSDFQLCPLTGDPRWFHHPQLTGAIHLLPTRFPGEGHFVAVLKKRGIKGPSTLFHSSSGTLFGLQRLRLKNGEFLITCIPPNVQKLQPLCAGIKLKDQASKSFYPHALSHYLERYDSTTTLTEEAQALDFLHGDEIRIQAGTEAPLTLVRYAGLSLGWGKLTAGRIKNYIPKNARLMNR